MDNRRPVQFMAALIVALGYHVRMGIRTVIDLMERRFAEFAGVPYQNPLSRQHWEELWETEADGTLTAADRDSSSQEGNAIRV
jgi:hypothetical protein